MKDPLTTMTRRTFLVFIFMISTGSAEIFNSAQISQIDAFVDDVMRCMDVPGLTVSVVKGEETWTKGFGVQDIESGVRVTADTLFGIGSVTKPFTTTLLSLLLNDTNGKYTWASKVSDILGTEFAFVDEARTREVTLKDLVTHRTGLQTAVTMIYAGYDHTLTRAEYAKRIRFLPEVKPFRDTWDYNNWMYGLAGYVVEVLSGESYEDTLRKRIFEPLGMTRSRVLGETVTAHDDGVAKPYFLMDNKLMLTNASIYDLYPAQATGSILSTANDMAKWIQFLLRNGQTTQNKALISPAKLMESFENYASVSASGGLYRPTFPVTDAPSGYGYGWYISTYRGYRKIWHSGHLHSYFSWLVLYPDMDSGVFVDVSGPGYKNPVDVVSYFLHDLLLGETPWLTSTTACTFPAPWITPVAPPLAVPDRNRTIDRVECYVGKYGHQFYGDLEIKSVSGSRSLMLQFKRLNGPLYATKDQSMFKFDFAEPLNIVTHIGNITYFPDVQFSKLAAEKYQMVSLIYAGDVMTFSRGVSFDDDIKITKKDDKPKADVCGQGVVSLNPMFMTLTLILCMLYVETDS